MVASTHRLHFVDGVVEKHYRSWDRGEPDREWNMLTLLDMIEPGLAPRPLDRRRDGGVPVVVMSRLPGASLGDEPVSAAEREGVAAALHRLQALGGTALDGVPDRIMGLAEMLPRVRDWCAGTSYDGLTTGVAHALTAGRRWLEDRAEADLEPDRPSPVLANGDGNLGNYVWDGRRCRLVDFEDAGVSELGYEVADLVEHLSASLSGRLDPESFIDLLGLRPEQRRHVLRCRRLFAVFWLLMLLPGNPAYLRNPPGSGERQATRVLALLREECDSSKGRT